MTVNEVAVFDIESTGVNPEEDRIVTAFLGVMHRTEGVTKSLTWLVNPGVDIPEGASLIHGVSNEKAQRFGIPAKQAVREIAVALTNLAQKMPLVIYNAPYDLTMIDREMRRHWDYTGQPKFHTVVDPFVIDKQLEPRRKGKRTLTATAARWGVDIGENAHDAEADCIAAGKLAFILMDKVGLTPGQLHDAQVEWKKKQAASLQEYFRRSNPEAVVSGQWPIILKEDK